MGKNTTSIRAGLQEAGRGKEIAGQIVVHKRDRKGDT